MAQADEIDVCHAESSKLVWHWQAKSASVELRVDSELVPRWPTKNDGDPFSTWTLSFASHWPTRWPVPHASFDIRHQLFSPVPSSSTGRSMSHQPTIGFIFVLPIRRGG